MEYSEISLRFLYSLWLLNLQPVVFLWWLLRISSKHELCLLWILLCWWILLSTSSRSDVPDIWYTLALPVVHSQYQGGVWSVTLLGWCLRTVDRTVTCYSCSEQCVFFMVTAAKSMQFYVMPLQNFERKQNSFFRHFIMPSHEKTRSFIPWPKFSSNDVTKICLLWCKCILFLLVGHAGKKDYWLRMGTCLRIVLPQLNYVTYKACFHSPF